MLLLSCLIYFLIQHNLKKELRVRYKKSSQRIQNELQYFFPPRMNSANPQWISWRKNLAAFTLCLRPLSQSGNLLENLKSKYNISGSYSVFPFLWRVVHKLSSEVGCGEVTNPKEPVRERDRQIPQHCNVTTCASMLRWGQCYFIATQQFADRCELGMFLARMHN